MKKLSGVIILAAMFVLGVSSAAFAATVTSGTPVNFAVTASIPLATGVSVTAKKVNAADNVWGTAEVTALDFNTAGTLSYDSALGIWKSLQYFAVDVGLVGGAASLSTNVKYVEGAKPTGQTKGLAYKATTKFVKVTKVPATPPATGRVDSETAMSYGTRLLNQLIGTGQTVSNADTLGGWLRLYVGIYDGGDTTINGLGGEPFTSADRPGTYNGTLTVTATAS